jgi:thiamine biosynthesis lipoprotein
MGTTVVVVGASDRAFAEIRALLERRDRTFSRFRADSELSRCNRVGGEIVPVSAEFVRALRVALAAARTTGGLVDPTVGAELEAAGYDCDFASLGVDPRPVIAVARGNRHAVAAGDGVLRRPPGTRLDLNGVVKSLAVDDAAELLDGPGYVSAGGDLAARGTPVLVALPDGVQVTLESGGIATSGSTRRQWFRGGELQHHLIDPRTGSPSRSPWSYVTAVGAACVAADVAAKAGFLLGDDGPEWLDERGVAGRFVGEDVTIENGCWTRSLRREASWA